MRKSTAIILILYGVAIISLLGCAGTQSSASRWSKGKVPPGISSEIAARVDILADSLFVPRESEKLAQAASVIGIRQYTITDSLWKLSDETRRKAAQQPKPVATDSASLVNNALLANNPTAQKSKAATIDLADNRMRIAASASLLIARKELEKAVLFDPFKPLTKHHLALTYKLFAERFPRDLSLDRAWGKWSELAALEPGEFRHYYNLATVAFGQKQWRKAVSNFQRAERLMKESAEVSDIRVKNPALAAEAGIDSSALFFAIYSQGQALIKQAVDDRISGRTAEADSADHHLTRARKLLADPTWHKLIDADLKYINWDERNIWGSALRDSAYALAERGQFNQAADIYDQLLNKILKTPKAKNEVKWDYATIEYTKLRRRAPAVQRLGEVIASVEKDADGAPEDTTYNNMFENFGAMCYFLGIDTMKINRKVAYDYFERATTIAWKERGKSYLQMAELSKTNIELSLKHAENAVKSVESFNRDERKMVFRLLAEGYRRKNDQENARKYFAKFRDLQ